MFSRLYKLARNKQENFQEDFLTEIFSEIFNDENLLLSFANHFIKEGFETVKLQEITTQKTYEKLNHHHTDSRPDIVLRFQGDNKNYVIFFENKLNSSEGHEQLKRYAEHLTYYNWQNTELMLIYLTKYFDEKEQTFPVRFKQIRWYQIYDWLSNHSNSFVNLLLEYMEDLKLDESRRFSPHDIYALNNINRLQNMMDECLDGPVEDKMDELFGRSKDSRSRNSQLKKHDRYFMYNDQVNYTGIGVGFLFTDEEYPYVSVMFEVNPKADNREDILKRIEDFADNKDWTKEYFDDPLAWAKIYSFKSLLEFLHEEDHINSIQSFLCTALEELHTFKEQNKDLGWKELH